MYSDIRGIAHHEIHSTIEITYRQSITVNDIPIHIPNTESFRYRRKISPTIGGNCTVRFYTVYISLQIVFESSRTAKYGNIFFTISDDNFTQKSTVPTTVIDNMFA